MYFVIALEYAHVRMKRMGTIKLDHLPHVPEVMKGKLVEQLVKAKYAKLFVPSCATAD